MLTTYAYGCKMVRCNWKYDKE